MNVIAEHLRQRDQALVVWLAYSEEFCGQAVQECAGQGVHRLSQVIRGLRQRLGPLRWIL